MDLLTVPKDPSIPTERAPYVCKEQWDGGPFLTYAQRKAQLSVVPPHLRHDTGGVSELEVPYTDLLYPAPRDQVESFCQTWLFFGLAAEFLGLNEPAGGEAPVDREGAARDIAALHAESIEEESGVRYLTGAAVLRRSSSILASVLQAPDLQQRVQHLANCLRFSCDFLQSIQPPFNQLIKFSIAALGELLTTAVRTRLSVASPKPPLPTLSYPWFRGYADLGSELEREMLQKGWCISEVEKIRTLYQGLNTRHYVARLKRPVPYGVHTNCSRACCRAFQLDPKTYTSAHFPEGCQCKHIEVDIEAVKDVLLRTQTFPVIRADLGDGKLENLAISVEEYRPGVRYVALSHVWADGLGNPTANSLPRCQVARIARLITDLQRMSGQPAATPGEEETYRIWADPLCCPVELETKNIALCRIADVYREAAHILVLDKSISSFASEGKHPAELLLRAIGCSAWMRRLWTLQEGALAHSVYFNFSDRPVNSFQVFQQLFQEGVRDARYMRIWHDVCSELNNLHSFRSIRSQESTDFRWPAPSLAGLQRSLYFRTVSVPSDEALCIATLMSLSLEHITAVESAEERMARVWELLAKAQDGLPLRMIFYNDDSLSLPGWRWAPRSLLGTFTKDSMLSIDEKTLRFTWGGGEAQRLRDVPQKVGIPTPLGLRVKAPGSLLRPVPRLPGLALHPWAGMADAKEDQIYLRAMPSGRWFRILDWYRSQKLRIWTQEEVDAYDAEASGVLCRAIDSGEYALIRDAEASVEAATHGCRMVRILNAPPAGSGDTTRGDEDSPFHVHAERTVVLSRLRPSEELVADVLRGLAHRAAEQTLAQGLVAPDSLVGAAREDAVAKLREMMKTLMAEAWSSQPSFVEAVRETVGPDMEEYFWVAISKFCSHDTELVSLNDDTTWIVD